MACLLLPANVKGVSLAELSGSPRRDCVSYLLFITTSSCLFATNTVAKLARFVNGFFFSQPGKSNIVRC